MSQSLSAPKHYFSEKFMDDIHRSTEQSLDSGVSLEQSNYTNPL
jgi:hypothetical protein